MLLQIVWILESAFSEQGLIQTQVVIYNISVAGGKIGIGTNSPNNTLEINSGSTTNSGLRFTH